MTVPDPDRRSDGRTRTLMSVAFVEMVMKARVARTVEDLDDDSLRSSAVPEALAHLDELVKDWKP